MSYYNSPSVYFNNPNNYDTGCIYFRDEHYTKNRKDTKLKFSWLSFTQDWVIHGVENTQYSKDYCVSLIENTIDSEEHEYNCDISNTKDEQEKGNKNYVYLRPNSFFRKHIFKNIHDHLISLGCKYWGKKYGYSSDSEYHEFSNWKYCESYEGGKYQPITFKVRISNHDANCSADIMMSIINDTSTYDRDDIEYIMTEHLEDYKKHYSKGAMYNF